MQSDLEQRLCEDKRRRLRDKIAIAISGLAAFAIMYTSLNFVHQDNQEGQTAVEFKNRNRRNYLERLFYRGGKAKDAAYEFVFGSGQSSNSSPAEKDGYISNNK